jgi:hypothetical protein
MFNRAIRTIFALTFAFAMFLAWWTYAAHAMCFENQLGDTCFYLNQMERANQMATPPVVSQAPQPEQQRVWPSEEVQCRRERELHKQLDHWATAGTHGKKWPSTPWCEKYNKGGSNE